MLYVFTRCINRCPSGVYAGNPLAGCVNDGKDLLEDLSRILGLTPGGRQTLFDAEATMEAQMRGFAAIQKIAVGGDAVVLHNSCHGTTMPDPDQADGVMDIICPADFDWDDPATWLTDRIMTQVVQGFAPGVLVTALFDSCHSGSMIDGLPVNGNRGAARTKPRRIVPPAAIQDEVLARVRRGARPRGFARAVAGATPDIAFIAGCQSSGTCADTVEDGRPCGAFTWAFRKALAGGPSASVEALAEGCCDRLEGGGYSQSPCWGGNVIRALAGGSPR
jgi:hypothetical protein